MVSVSAPAAGVGKIATRSAWAVGRDVRSRLSAEGREKSELREVHQSPVESFCTRAYFRFLAGDCGVEAGCLTSEASSGPDVKVDGAVGSDGNIDSTSKGTETEWNEA